MDRDRDLTQLFSDFKPEIQNSDDFMAQLQHKLNAVEFIKQKQKEQARIHRYCLLAVFLLGSISGAALLGIAVIYPQTSPLFSLDVPSVPFLWFFQKNIHSISYLCIAFLITTGIIAIVSQWQDVLSYSHSKKKRES